jgi:hypothetical protein
MEHEDLCPAVTAGHTSTAKYDDPAFQDDDGYPYFVGTELLKALHHYCPLMIRRP